MRSSFCTASCVVAACLLPRAVFAASTNATIDDNYGNSVTGDKPTYSNDWNYGPECPTCYIQPDKTKTYEQSWHDVTASLKDLSARNVSFSFNGTAIYIYGILPPPVQYTTTYVNVSVQLDGQVVGRFEHHNTGQTGYQYNVTVYQNTSLEHGVHNVVITARRDVNASYFAFDWAQYTYDPDHSTASTTSSTSPITPTTDSSTAQKRRSHSSVGPIVGGVVGGIAAVFLAILAFIFWRRRTQDKLNVIESFDGGAARGGAIDPVNKPEPIVAAAVVPKLHSLASLPTSDVSASQGMSVTAIVSPTTSSPSATDSPPSSARRAKTARQRAELSRQMHDMEAQVAELRRRQTVRNLQPPPALQSPAGSPAPVAGGHEDVDLRRQIEALQLEVERLRASAAMDEPPPAYEESEGSSRR
ncbi:hypothetical protein FOMPIDRAFT_1021181 [Fomitopsis schrenkii]|uniref:Uncharacterized protein n=1 Tax=Fomitopsis schrenkii TaxID=2126942 RepID=S8EPQ5_FOMSC|nr:hypothetical protein FOMPIDRAFT_1021181 [Fomitopsis schrenkii]